jgi:predicted  nucleic acid-binding Zn-ribbon protein
MTLRFQRLRLRALTTDGVYGANVPFSPGLTVLWADNTKGKSTCMQGMLYALGLERMLSPRREIPLPHAMTTYLNTDDEKRIEVLESSVSLEIANGNGQVITVNRGVKATTDTRLITVDFGAALSGDSAVLGRQNFFVLDPGAAQREDGFHHFLEGFLGWRLPQVRRYDAPETKLYLETVFPLFWVEQKFGWTAIPAAIPTYMRIREVHKRAVEFIMDLDVYKFEVQRERLAERLAANSKEWSVVRQELERFVARGGGRVVALPENPIADSAVLSKAHVQLAEGKEWAPLSSVISRLRVSIADLASRAVPAVEEQSEEVAQKLSYLTQHVDELNAERIRVHGIQQLKTADIQSLKRRIAALEDDLAKNLDVQRLQRYSGVTAALTPDRCPTCEQALVDTLLSQNALSAVMPVSDNIEYIRSQKKMFEDILAREKFEENERRDHLSAIGRTLADYYAQIRLLRSELVAPGANPSAAVIEERVRAEARLRDLEALQAIFDDALERLCNLQESYSTLLLERTQIPTEKFSPGDHDKLNRLRSLVQDQAKDFGFSTFSPAELSISQDSYRPEKEGFEIGFETSASDAIRLKWAYQLSLLELASDKPTNHPGTLVFDEPRQQSSSRPSFQNLLNRAARARKRNQQVIFSTSEDLETLKSITSAIDCDQVIFPGYILQKLE